MSVPTVLLASIAEVKLGRQRSPQNHAGPSMRKYLRAANVGWSGLLLEDVKSMNFSDAEMDTFRLKPGDILLNEASGSATEVGKPAIWNGEIENCAFQNTLLRVRCAPNADPRYLLHYFRWQAATAAFARGSRGVGINHLGREALARWPVPLPLLDEQRRIAAILDHANDLRTKQRSVIAKLDNLNRAIFAAVFSTGLSRPRWPTVRLGAVVLTIDSGTSPVCENRKASDGEWGVLKLGAISYGVFNPEENKAFLGDQPSIRKVEVQPGDLLFSRKNTKGLVGATAIAYGTPPLLLLPDLIFRLNLDRDRVDAEYLHALLRSPRTRPAVVALASGSASSMSNISKARLAELLIELPPIELQHAYSERVRTVHALSDQGIEVLAELDDLLSALQSRAFSGQL